MTGSAVPPGVVAEATAAAKAWLRAADGQDEDTIARLCLSAITLAEAFCARAFVLRAFEETIAPTGAWQPLGAAPVMAITAVGDAATAAVLPADAYAVDIDAAGTGWLRATRPALGRVTVTYAAGEAGSWALLPPPVAQGIVMLVAHLDDHRDGEALPPAAVAALWRPWRRMTLRQEHGA